MLKIIYLNLLMLNIIYLNLLMLKIIYYIYNILYNRIYLNILPY